MIEWGNLVFDSADRHSYHRVAMITHGFVGLYWLIPGILFSFIKALVDAWVLLVEIHR